MARARNIKPGFWTNEHIVELDPWARLLYIGLWAVADREGRLEDRPKRIKMEVFPADVVDVDALLSSIEKEGLIRRYSGNGLNLIWIPGFREHQNPHKNEKSSDLPPHPEDGFEALLDNSSNGESDPAERGKMNPDSLNDDSGLLNDSGANAPATPEKPKPKTKRATQVPDDFAVTEQLKAWGASQDPPFSPESMRVEVPQFVDYYRAKGEARKDWDASFRTWMRNSRKFDRGAPPGRSSPQSSGKITTVDELFAIGDDDEPSRDPENSHDSATRMAAERPGQSVDSSLDVSTGRHGFRVVAGGGG